MMQSERKGSLKSQVGVCIMVQSLRLMCLKVAFLAFRMIMITTDSDNDLIAANKYCFCPDDVPRSAPGIQGWGTAVRWRPHHALVTKKVRV